MRSCILCRRLGAGRLSRLISGEDRTKQGLRCGSDPSKKGAKDAGALYSKGTNVTIPCQS
ncbi:hypothetical protein CBM2623_B130019 [Cupriavidus taiwanensis]|nr:hypothetical protein CBM2623_B130019 [Cupriavidus taiwanensis]